MLMRRVGEKREVLSVGHIMLGLNVQHLDDVRECVISFTFHVGDEIRTQKGLRMLQKLYRE